MPVYTIYTLESSNITVSGGEQLSGITQGDGSHLMGETITLNSNDWVAVDIDDSNDSNFDDSDTSQSLENAISYDGTAYAAGLRVESEYEMILQDPDGNTYTVLAFNIHEPGGTSYATVEGLAFVGGVGGFPPIGVPLTVISTGEGPSDPYSSLATPPCFTAGCLIDTTNGPVPVETLEVGDLVETLDHGPQPIRWIGRRRFPAAVLQREAGFRPILVRKDAFGPGQPGADIRLSPQHRVLVQGWRAELMTGEAEVLVPVKKLVNDTSIRVCGVGTDVTYVHILFDGHEIVTCDGLLTESYFTGETTPDATDTRAEILRIFPTLGGSMDMAAARPVVSNPSAALLPP